MTFAGLAFSDAVLSSCPWNSRAHRASGCTAATVETYYRGRDHEQDRFPARFSRGGSCCRHAARCCARRIASSRANST